MSVSNSNLDGIILAAGSGITPSDSIPKCLLPIDSTTILSRQINILRWCHIKNVLVVAGAQGACWNQESHARLKRECNENHARLMVNPINSETGSCYSLYLGFKNVLDCRLIVVDGDVVFDKELIEVLANSRDENILVSRPALSISESGGKVLLDGMRVIAAGDKIQSDKFGWNIYSGIMKIGAEIKTDLQEELMKNKKKHVLTAMGALCNKHKIFNIDLDKVNNETKPGFLVGGSFASLERLVLVRKQDHSSYGSKKLAQEIIWLLALPPDLQQHFPKVLHHQISPDFVWYDIPFYDIPSLRKLFFVGKIKAEKGLELLKTLMDFMFSKVYSRSVRKGGATWVYKLHIQRIENRLMTTIERSNVFRDIINAEHITINGRHFQNIPAIIGCIKTRRELIEVLAPPFISMIHGDLHFQNVLVDLEGKSKSNFILMDPKGEVGGSDPFYDLGKLWHSFHGLYDFIHEDLFNVDLKVKDNEVIAQFELDENPMLLEYQRLNELFPEWIAKNSPLNRDPNWEMRTLFSEAAHFCSVMPFHLKMDGVEKRAMALYLTGVKLLNEFAEKYKIEKWKEDLSWINVNTPEDYLRARRLLN